MSPTNPKKARELVNSFFFFKALGFVITPQSVVVAVSGAEPHSYGVQACLGPRGLTRLAVQLQCAAECVARLRGKCPEGSDTLLAPQRAANTAQSVPPCLQIILIHSM